MIKLRVARSALATFDRMLEQGAEKFGLDLVLQKQALVQSALSGLLCDIPHLGRWDLTLKLYSYSITDTPFVIFYEYDDEEVRVLFISHQRADHRRLHRDDVTW
jgi:plasmid stabilization system protein ParE